MYTSFKSNKKWKFAVIKTMTNNDKDETLRIVALELMYNNPQKWQSPEGPTTQEIARRHNLPLDIVKRQLAVLLEAGLVRSISYSPKRWQFDEYNFDRMSAEDPLLLIITRYEDEDYERFYF